MWCCSLVSDVVHRFFSENWFHTPVTAGEPLMVCNIQRVVCTVNKFFFKLP